MNILMVEMLVVAMVELLMMALVEKLMVVMVIVERVDVALPMSAPTR